MNYKLILVILALVSCVKKRPVERFQDLDGMRWEKATVLTERPWLYRVTIVNNGLNSKFGFVGLQSTPRLGYFDITKSQLRFVEVKANYADGPNTEKVINAWNITHTDIHRKVIDGRKSNVETENNDIPWNEKRFFKVDWSTAEIKERASFSFFGLDNDCWSPLSSQVVDGEEEVTSEHIGFVLAVNYQIKEECISNRDYDNNDFTLTIHYKYSFMPEPDVAGYAPYVYTGENDPLMDKYGYFNTTVLSYDENNRSKNTFYMNRWNPNKKHTFYFSENFPEEYKWIYNDPQVGIFPRTNKLFEEKGLPVRFEIKDNDGSKKFGDIRYSFVHFVNEPDLSAPLGYGPMTAHPRTGEIISAHSVLWTNDLKWYVQQIRDRQKRNETVSSTIIAELTKTIGQGVDTWSSTSSFLKDARIAETYRYLIPEFTYELPGTGFAGREVPLQFDSLEKVMKDQPAFLEANREMAEQLNRSKLALEEATNAYRTREYYNNPSISTRYDLNEGLVAGLANVDLSNEKKIIDDILYRVAIHEFGHNLNLRHNFYGTVGARIDAHKEGGDPNKTTSSVMDYLTMEDEIGQAYDWEAYDQAALLYAYSDGKVDISRDRPAPYLFCTDHHTVFNPMCNRFDSGATPSEIVKNHILSYDDAYWIRNFRYGRSYWNTSGYSGSVFRTMFDLKKMIRFYEQAFGAVEVRDKLRKYPLQDAESTARLTQGMQADMLQAVKLVLSFYRSVIKQGSFDRSFADRFEESTGALAQQGIAMDKIFASMFMLGDDAFPLDPNKGFTPVSVLSIRKSSPELKPFVDMNISDIFVEGGEMYAGFTETIRSFYAYSAASAYELSSDLSDLQLLRVNCYNLSTFATRFGTPAASLGENATEITTINQTLNPDYAGETSVVALKVGDVVLTAGKRLNPMSAAVLLDNDKAGARSLGTLYQKMVYSRPSLTCE
ncbi:zinc-dependent metalloprotease [Oligoflexus tunisiensis]|uniref:zinc-dependent metalloprotease n=1 Tax=Oligoflexus tunisiensis TaxID=708132 RepID=UPI00114D3971|nr:zinc-dependent metalloprotease [Oligoflexus tunisiensis]